MLGPAFIIAEATLSYVGVGFPEPVASCGTIRHDASEHPYGCRFTRLVSPAAAVLWLNLLLQRSGINPATISPDEPFWRLRPDSGSFQSR